MELLRLTGLQKADPSEVVRIIGTPEAVYENRRYPGVFYWRLKSYRVTTAPVCLMLLPRNPNYDAMLQMWLECEDAKPVSLTDALAASHHLKNKVVRPNESVE